MIYPPKKIKVHNNLDGQWLRGTKEEVGLLRVLWGVKNLSK